MGRDQGRTSDILEAVALLVVDMQETFLNTIAENESLVRRCAFAIEAARALGIRVVFTEQVPEKLGPTLSALRQAAPDARVFHKNTFSALGAQGLVEHLRKAGVYHLLIAGIETPVCVYQTALHAQDSDFDVTILSDCVGARRTDDARIVLQALAAASCHVLPAETVYYSMLGNSAHRAFAAYTELVKRHGDATTPAAPTKPAKTRAKKTRGKAQEEAPTIAPPEPAEVLVPFQEPESKTRRTPRSERVSGEVDSDNPSPDAREDENESGDWQDPADRAESDAPSDADADQEPARKRPRRRRGGARRRKARERAAGENGAPAEERAPDAPAGEPWTPPEPPAHSAPTAAPEKDRPTPEN